MQLIGGPNFIEGFFWSWFGCVSWGLSGCEVCIFIWKGVEATSWPQNLRREPAGTPHTDNIMAPSFVEGTRWEPGLCGRGRCCCILRVRNWTQHLVQLPAAGLIFGHVATIRTSLWEDVSWQKPTRGCCVAKGC